MKRVEGVIVVVCRGEQYLLIRRSGGVIAPGAWCFVGGAVEPGETQAEAVVREFGEEVGGVVRAVRKVWEDERADGSLRLHWWLAELVDGELRANPAEVAELRWCTRAEIRALPGLLPNNLTFLDEVAHDELHC